MKMFFKFNYIYFAVIIFFISAGCAEIESESSGYASLQVKLNDVSKRDASRTANRNHAPSMTTEDAKTILALLMPAVKCSSSTAGTGEEFSRALVDPVSLEAEFLIPLDTQLKLCVYFFRNTYTINELNKGEITPDGFGESDIFTVDSETTSKTVAVEFWTTSYATLTLKISSISSVGLLEGSEGTVKINSSTGLLVDNSSFTISSSDNESKSVVFSDVVYSSYAYEVEVTGFIPEEQAFLVSNETELLDVKLTPNAVDIDWLSYDNTSISQIDTSPYATATGTLVLSMPNEYIDNVTQMVSLQQIKRVGGSTILDVTPPVALANWTKTEGSDNVTYTTQFTSGSLPLVHGSNEIQIVLTVNKETRIQTLGTIGYDACIDSNTMCANLTWTDGLDPDLHSYYFPDWSHNEELGGSFDNSSRGLQYWIYSNTAYKKYSPTGDTIQLTDGSSSSDNETQVWATDSHKVGNGTYLFFVEDVSETDVQNFKLVLSGPGLSDNLTFGPYDFKDDLNASTTEALDPQAVFFIQVDNNSIVRVDNITIGDNLSSSLLQWTGPLQNSVVD